MASKKHTATAQGATAVKRTAEYWFNTIANKKIRETALYALHKEGDTLNDLYPSLERALSSAICWLLYINKVDFSEVFDKIQKGTLPLRPHPSEPKITVSDKLNIESKKSTINPNKRQYLPYPPEFAKRQDFLRACRTHWKHLKFAAEPHNAGIAITFFDKYKSYLDEGVQKWFNEDFDNADKVMKELFKKA